MNLQLSKNQKIAIIAAGVIVPLFMKISRSIEVQKIEMNARYLPVSGDMKSMALLTTKKSPWPKSHATTSPSFLLETPHRAKGFGFVQTPRALYEFELTDGKVTAPVNDPKRIDAAALDAAALNDATHATWYLASSDKDCAPARRYLAPRLTTKRPAFDDCLIGRLTRVSLSSKKVNESVVSFKSAGAK